MTDLDDARIQVVKALLDEFPKVRAFARGYLAVYHPTEDVAKHTNAILEREGAEEIGQ